MEQHLAEIAAIPAPSIIQCRFQALAVLDAIMSPDWDYRYFSYNSLWEGDSHMASMRNVNGDEYFFLIDANGIAGKVFCKDYPHYHPGDDVIAKISAHFPEFMEEPAFSIEYATCFLWQAKTEKSWSIAPPTNTHIPRMAYVCDNGKFYAEWAADYYETEIDIELVQKVFKMQRLSEEDILSINPDADMDSVLEDILEIGYPR